MKRIAILSSFLLIGAACKKDSGSPPRPDEAARTEPPPAPAEPAPAAEKPIEAPPEAAAEVTDVVDIGLSTPESVLYDDGEDLYLVSNINGSPAEADDNGFISRVGPDGQVRELKWIDGSKEEVKLDAPKGMAILGDTLYVADITSVRMFDRKTGAPRGDIAIKGATFLNDMVTAGDSVYVSDSGFKPDFKPSGSDAIHVIGADGKTKPLLEDKKLGAPNGLAAAADGLWVVTFGSGEIFSVGADGKKKDAVKLPKGQLDGIVALPDGSLLVSSWEAKAVFRGDGKEWKPLVEGVESPADLGYDSKRKKIVIPLFMGNALAIRAAE